MGRSGRGMETSRETKIMTSEQKIKHTILYDAIDQLPEVTVDNIDELWEQYRDETYDFEMEFREGEEVTDIEPDWSRHYESKSVAAKMIDDTWVGWTYWYGGGKHANPEGIDWMSAAYPVEMCEEVKTMVVRTFVKK